MSYREAFWLATSAAAPVIALAAVAATPEAVASLAAVSFREEDLRRIFLGKNRDPRALSDAYWHSVGKANHLAFAVTLASTTNVVAQAVLLGLSLASLATSHNLTEPWVAIVLAVGGILVLAWTSSMGPGLRKKLRRVAIGRPPTDPGDDWPE